MFFRSRLYGRVLSWIKRLRQHRFVDERPPTSGEKRFAKHNEAFWTRVFPQAAGREGYVLVELHMIAYLTHYVASIGRIAAEAKQANLLALTLPNRNVYPQTVLQSYGPMDWVRFGPLRHLWFQIQAWVEACRAYWALDTPDELLRLRVDRMLVGDLVYDDILRWDGYATLDKVDRRALKRLHRFFYYRAAACYIIRTYPIRFAVFSHVVGCDGGVFVRYLLRAGVPVLLCRSAAQPTLKKYGRVNEIWDNPMRPDPVYVEHALQNVKQEVTERAKAYLKERFTQQVSDPDAGLAFESSKRTYTDRVEFAKAYGLRPGRKNVFVMLHALNDYPHSQGIDSILFRDYYHWLVETLRIATDVSTVNWIFKEHPTARLYQTQDLDYQELFGDVGQHVTFIDYRADFNARSIQHVADAAVTCLGTAGLEYAAVGIPFVLAGRSAYSGFGFTFEPDNVEGYERQLRSIDSLRRLTALERERALMILFLHLRMLKNDPFLFLPNPDYYHGRFKYLNVTGGVGLEEFWADTGRWLEALVDSDAREEARQIAAFIRHSDSSQYVDFNKYPFMRTAGVSTGVASAVT